MGENFKSKILANQWIWLPNSYCKYTNIVGFISWRWPTTAMPGSNWEELNLHLTSSTASIGPVKALWLGIHAVWSLRSRSGRGLIEHALAGYPEIGVLPMSHFQHDHPYLCWTGLSWLPRGLCLTLALTLLHHQTLNTLTAKDACLSGIKGIFPPSVAAALFGSGSPQIRVTVPSLSPTNCRPLSKLHWLT